MVTVLNISDIERRLKNVIEGEACRAFYRVFGPSPNIADISRQLSCILLILQLYQFDIILYLLVVSLDYFNIFMRRNRIAPCLKREKISFRVTTCI